MLACFLFQNLLKLLPMEQKQKVSPKDVFIHLLAIIALYFSAGSFITLIFQAVNLKFPDKLEAGQYYLASSSLGSIRFAIASLIIIFPVYIITSWFLNRLYTREPEKRNLRIRKWLIYFTLFIAALTIIGNLVTLVYTFLQGELTARFIFKVITIFFVAGSIFFYYWTELKNYQDKVAKKKLALGPKIFIYGVAAIVLAALVWGFTLAGSPKNERLRRFDNQRISDLQMIQSYLTDYWQNKNKLPEKLADLNDNLRGVIIPKDPETSLDYSYSIDSLTSLKLCANFAFADQNVSAIDIPAVPTKPTSVFSSPIAWQHSAGENCFNRVIDKDFFPKPIKL